MDQFLTAAVEEAMLGMQEGGVPIGSVLVVDGKIVGRGHNRQRQLNSIIRHAEVDCIDHAGNLSPAEYQRSTLYTTLSPCDMCSGAILFFKIPRVVVGEHFNIMGAEEYLRSRGVEVTVLNDPECIRMLSEFDRDHPGAWNKGE
jgi:cytosine/creatinine deaminase